MANERQTTSAPFLALALIASLAIPLSVQGAERVAITTKLKGKVELRTLGSDDFKSLARGTILKDRDFVRTGSDGLLILVYLDDKSMLKVKQNTDMEIRGTRQGDGISKKVDMVAGTLKAEISKQRKGDFVISTPTSTASVKGTTFWIISDPRTGDQVMCIEGLVELMNLASGAAMMVGPGQTGTSHEGVVDVRATTPDETPEDIKEEEIKENVLRIILTNPEGDQKDIVITFE